MDSPVHQVLLVQWGLEVSLERGVLTEILDLKDFEVWTVYQDSLDLPGLWAQGDLPALPVWSEPRVKPDLRAPRAESAPRVPVVREAWLEQTAKMDIMVPQEVMELTEKRELPATPVLLDPQGSQDLADPPDCSVAPETTV